MRVKTKITRGTRVIQSYVHGKDRSGEIITVRRFLIKFCLAFLVRKSGQILVSKYSKPAKFAALCIFQTPVCK